MIRFAVPPSQGGNTPGITIAVPTTLDSDGAEHTARTLLTSLTLADTPGEILIVANGPRRNAAKFRIDDPRVRVVQLERGSAPAARNLALSLAAFDLVGFTDDYCSVSPYWVRDVIHQLEGNTVCCGPVDIDVSGPITAYLNYQRFLHAPPLNTHKTRYLITANCALRRKTLSSDQRFDDQHFNNAAEDADLGYRLRAGGHTLTWTPHARVIHHMPEAVPEVTDRFTRYGRGNAVLARLHDRWEESAPGGHRWLASIRDGGYLEHRRFSEMEDPQVAQLFTILDLARTVSFLLGYFEIMGQQLGTRIVEWEPATLDAGWHALVTGAAARLRTIDTAHDLRDQGPVFLGPDAPERQGGGDPYVQVAQLLTRAITVNTTHPPDIDQALHAHAEIFTAWTDSATARLLRLTSTHRQPISIDELDDHARSAGIALPDAAHELEKYAATKPARKRPTGNACTRYKSTQDDDEPQGTLTP